MKRRRGGLEAGGRKIVARDRLEGIVWTRERLLEAAGFRFVGDTAAAVKRLRGAVQSRNTQDALRACELTFDLADVKPRVRMVEGDRTAPVAIEIVLTHQPVAPGPEPLQIVDVTPGDAGMPIPGPMPGLATPGPLEAEEIRE